MTRIRPYLVHAPCGTGSRPSWMSWAYMSTTWSGARAGSGAGPSRSTKRLMRHCGCSDSLASSRNDHVVPRALSSRRDSARCFALVRGPRVVGHAPHVERRVGIERERSKGSIIAGRRRVDRVCSHGVRCDVRSAGPFRASEGRRGPSWTLVHDRERSHHRGARLVVRAYRALTLGPLRRASRPGAHRSRSTFVRECLSRADRAARRVRSKEQS